MKSVMMILGAILVVILLGAALDAINDFRGGSYTDTFNVSTGSNETSSDCTLSQDLLDDKTAYAAISSNCTDDAPVPSSYNSATGALTVGGLQASTQRMLTVVYSYPQLSSYWAADTAARTWPMFLVLGVIGVIGGAVYIATKGNF